MDNSENEINWSSATSVVFDKHFDFHRMPELNTWIDHNCLNHHTWIVGHQGLTVLFMDPNDALVFKLAWL